MLQVSVNLLAQIIPGTLLPGQPLANMFFKVYSIQTLEQSTTFVQDLKLGHYIKVPPRATFLGALLSRMYPDVLDTDIWLSAIGSDGPWGDATSWREAVAFQQCPRHLYSKPEG